MSFSKAMKLVFSDMMFKVIVTIMIVVLTLQSTIRDYDYVIDVERLDSNMVNITCMLGKLDTVLLQINPDTNINQNWVE